jgi:hypothetical protein
MSDFDLDERDDAGWWFFGSCHRAAARRATKAHRAPLKDWLDWLFAF